MDRESLLSRLSPGSPAVRPKLGRGGPGRCTLKAVSRKDGEWREKEGAEEGRERNRGVNGWELPHVILNQPWGSPAAFHPHDLQVFEASPTPRKGRHDQSGITT